MTRLTHSGNHEIRQLLANITDQVPEIWKIRQLFSEFKETPIVPACFNWSCGKQDYYNCTLIGGVP